METTLKDIASIEYEIIEECKKYLWQSPDRWEFCNHADDDAVREIQTVIDNTLGTSLNIIWNGNMVGVHIRLQTLENSYTQNVICNDAYFRSLCVNIYDKISEKKKIASYHKQLVDLNTMLAQIRNLGSA